jgi:hypothetical protein
VAESNKQYGNILNIPIEQGQQAGHATLDLMAWVFSGNENYIRQDSAIIGTTHFVIVLY